MTESPSTRRQIWIDGELVPWERATVHLLSHCVQRGSLVFDYMSVHRTPLGVFVFRLPQHVDRFLRSCELVGLPIALSGPAISEAVRATVRANAGATHVKLSAYFASIEVDVVPLDNRVSVAVAAYDPVADILGKKSVPPRPSQPEVRLWIEKARQHRRNSILPPQAKVAAKYASPMMAKSRARDAGYDEILLLDEEGYVAEAPTSNVFLVDGEGTLATPAEAQVLHGVTRRSILELAEHQGVPVRVGRISPEELKRAAEVFLTGTTAGVLPASSVDGQKIGDGRIGPVTARLRDQLSRILAGEDAEFSDWLIPVDEG